MSFLKKFFAVTISGSLYKVEFNEAEDIGIVEKVALQKGSQSGLPVGTKLGIGTNDFAGRGDFIGLANYGLVIYYGYGKKRPLMEFINNHYWGGKTSAIVALFLKKQRLRNA